MKDTPEGWKAAEMAASQIELDILSGNFDPTLAKYKSNSKVKSVVDSTPRVPTIQELWKDYVKYRSKVVKKSTLRKQFQPITNYLGKLPYKHVEDHIKIQDRVWNDKTPQGAKRLFTQLSAMCKWAVSRGLISENPFEGKASEIKLSKSTDSDEMDVNSFTVEERGKSIAAFSSSCYYKSLHPMH
ncbi:MAG: hypothetical protein F6K00_09455 [Leptolyngbya sp. SIOISBB]|nr:hypothetical protein [Leptolyngbya sp. SIOISBB]